MYEEGREALFRGDVGEYAAMCAYALRNEEARRKIAAAGQARIQKNGHYNEVVVEEILGRVTRRLGKRAHLPSFLLGTPKLSCPPS